jgi:hypothetical protein
MARIIKATPAHYETHEVPFGKSYEGHPEYILLECDCGQKLILSGTSNLPSCPECGADYGSLVQEIRLREKRQLCGEVEYPWLYNEQSQADQHLRDEKDCPEDSPWRYNDVTSGFVGDDEERWKKARERRGVRSANSE